MTRATLIRRSLRFHARAHFGVWLGAAIGSAALIGALLVGDSVRASLRERALARLGPIQVAVHTPDRFFLQDLQARLARAVPNAELSAALLLPGAAARQDGTARANRIQLLGVDTSSWPRLAGWPALSAGPGTLAADEVLVNPTLARQLRVKPGDTVIVRVQKPAALTQDAVITPRSQSAVALRLRVRDVLPARELADFSLAANQVPPANAFVPLQFLQERTGLTNRADLLVGAMPTPPRSSDAGLRKEPMAAWTHALERVWQPEDGQISVRVLALTNGVSPQVEISSARIFLDEPVIAAVLTPEQAGFVTDSASNLASGSFVTNASPILTYLANLLRAGERATPYSMVTAAGAPWVPAGMQDDEILVNEWLAEDLQAKPGDRLELSYYLVDSGSRLIERTNLFRIRGVVPLAGLYADRSLMPEFPGLARAESTHDWDAGFPLVHPIRDQDEAYWKKYRGTPKAYVTLAAGQKMWANRFGSLTAIRYPVPAGEEPMQFRAAAYAKLRTNLDPAALGLRFEAVREQALKAAEQSQDFGQLFLGFSFFLILAALLLMGLLFQFNLEQRITEVGTFLALGFTARRVRRLLLAEAAVLALAGGLVGALGGAAYARAMLEGLRTIWRRAVGAAELHFAWTPASLALGIFAGSLVALCAIWLTLRKQARQPAYQLLAGEIPASKGPARNLAGWVALVCGAGALAIVGWAIATGAQSNAEVFFSAGSLFLVAGIGLAAVWLRRLEGNSPAVHARVKTGWSLADLGVRACARRRKRSLATIGLLACGCFITMAIGVFRLDANADAGRRSSGTGGFVLLGESALPIVQDLNTDAGREFFALTRQQMAGVNLLSFRVREGDEASCLNLNRAQKPRLLGVKPELLKGRFRFAAVAPGCDPQAGWNLLKGAAQASGEPSSAQEEVPAIGDANSIQWALGKKVGDTLQYTDERGRAFKLRLVAALANSVLQGSLVIDEAEFVRRFPTESGYRFFLIDASAGTAGQASSALSRALQDNGLELTPATERLDAFNAVQNTYLSTFQVLGGLGLLLGSAGLGVLVLRNVLERRAELGLLLALGFRRRALEWLVLSEHGALLAAGLGLGVVAATVAVGPSLLTPGAEFPFRSLAVTLGAVLLNGVAWTWAATLYALRGDLLAALRNE